MLALSSVQLLVLLHSTLLCTKGTNWAYKDLAEVRIQEDGFIVFVIVPDNGVYLKKTMWQMEIKKFLCIDNKIWIFIDQTVYLYMSTNYLSRDLTLWHDFTYTEPQVVPTLILFLWTDIWNYEV